MAVARAGEREHFAPLCNGDLCDQMRRRAEPVDAEAGSIAREAVGLIADQTRTEQRGCFNVTVAVGQCEAETLVRKRVLGVAAVDLIAGEASLGAEIFSRGA